MGYNLVFSLLFLHLFSRAQCKKYDPDIIDLIVGPKEIDIKSYPHTVYVDVKCYDEEDILQVGRGCGASILNQLLLLTTARCLTLCNSSQTSLIRVQHGVTNWTEMGLEDITAYKTHEYFERRGNIYYNDIALIKINQPMKLGPVHKRVAISRYIDIKKIPAYLTGWGRVIHESDYNVQYLKVVEQETKSYSNCAKMLGYEEHPSVFCGIPAQIQNYPLKGDYGGPLVLQMEGFIQIGIASNYMYHSLRKHVMLYTNVTHHYDWILSSARDLYCTDQIGHISITPSTTTKAGETTNIDQTDFTGTNTDKSDSIFTNTDNTDSAVTNTDNTDSAVTNTDKTDSTDTNTESTNTSKVPGTSNNTIGNETTKQTTVSTTVRTRPPKETTKDTTLGTTVRTRPPKETTQATESCIEPKRKHIGSAPLPLLLEYEKLKNKSSIFRIIYNNQL